MAPEQIDLKMLERASPIIAVAIELGIKVQGSMGTCFRKDRHAPHGEQQTLFFNPAKNTFQCRSCPDVGGSVIDLVCQRQGWKQEEAIAWLAHRAEFDQLTQRLYRGKGKKK
jgi:hypothetical protein